MYQIQFMAKLKKSVSYWKGLRVLSFLCSAGNRVCRGETPDLWGGSGNLWQRSQCQQRGPASLGAGTEPSVSTEDVPEDEESAARVLDLDFRISGAMEEQKKLGTKMKRWQQQQHPRGCAHTGRWGGWWTILHTRFSFVLSGLYSWLWSEIQLVVSN